MSSMALKLTALVCMIIDHMGAMLIHLHQYRDLASNMRNVGRVSFPVFCFLIAEGMRKTKSRPKYLLWLAVFAVISIVPFSMFNSVWINGFYSRVEYFNFSLHNVFFTLFLGGASIYAFDLIRGSLKAWLIGIPGHILGLAAPAACAYAAHNLNTDYGYKGVLMIFAVYWVMSFQQNNFFRPLPAEIWRFLRVIPMAVWAHKNYKPGIIPEWVPFFGGSLSVYGVFAAIAPLLVLLYDGTPGSARLRGGFKIWFYAFYPAHYLALYAWSIFLRQQF